MIKAVFALVGLVAFVLFDMIILTLMGLVLIDDLKDIFKE